MILRVFKYLVLLLLIILPGCENTGKSPTSDHTWFVDYFVSNESSVDVVVAPKGPLPDRYGIEPVTVPSGALIKLAYYSAFLAPPPDAGKDFICISVHRASDYLLISQFAPVTNAQWNRVDPRKYHAEFTLVIDDTKLNLNGVPNSCGNLSGTVVDSLTTHPIERVVVSFQRDSSETHDYSRITDNTGFYSFTWSDTVPFGVVEFLQTGYQPKQFSIPEDVVSLGDRRYRLDVELSPAE